MLTRLELLKSNTRQTKRIPFREIESINPDTMNEWVNPTCFDGRIKIRYILTEKF